MRDCPLLRQERTDDNGSTEETCLEQFYGANPGLPLPGGCTQSPEQGRLLVQCEGRVLESRERDRKAVVRESVHAKPGQWVTLQSPCSGKHNAIPSPPRKGARPRQGCTPGAAHPGLQHSPAPSSRWSCARIFKSSSNY